MFKYIRSNIDTSTTILHVSALAWLKLCIGMESAWYSSARRCLDTLPEERTARLVGRMWMLGLPTAPVWNWFPRLIGLASGRSECIRWYCRCSLELVDHAINTGLNNIDVPFRRRYYVEMLWQVSDCTICWDHQERDMNFLAKLCEWIIGVR